MRVREATDADRVALLNVLDGAALRTDAEAVRDAIDRGDALVAVSGDGERVLGGLVLDGDRITGVAVRRRRRGQGVGTALVSAAADHRERLVAEFDADVRPFYESLAFDVEPIDENRFRGVTE